MKAFLRLLLQTLRQFKSSIISILIGAAIFAAILLLLQGFFEQQADRVIRLNVVKMGIPEERFEDIQGRMKQGDEAAFEELLLEMGRAAESFDTMDESSLNAFITEQSFTVAMALLPFSLLFITLTCLIGILSSTYFLVLGTSQTKDPLFAGRRTLAAFFKMVGLWIWILLRSFVWIPVVGIFTGIYFLPRFVLSPVILLGEDRGVFESVRESASRTKGSWFTVVGNLLGLGVSTWITWTFFVLLISFTGKLMPIFMAVGSQLIAAYMALFTVLFARRFSPEFRRGR